MFQKISLHRFLFCQLYLLDMKGMDYYLLELILFITLWQVQEAASGSVFVQMPDVWINLAHVYFAQGNFALAVKMVSLSYFYFVSSNPFKFPLKYL